MNYFRIVLITFMSIFIPVGAQAQFIQSMCPQIISVKNNAPDAPEEWMLNGQLTKDDDGQFPLARILFSYGDPVEIAYMAPLSDQTKTKNGLKINTASWNFRLTDEEIWISCEYKDSGITLKKILPSNIRTCNATAYYKKPGHLLKVVYEFLP